jgi:Flp pilus assembly protein TadG
MTVLVLSRISAAMSSLRRLIRSECASVATTFALATPVVFGVVGVAVDYSMASATRTKMQMVADSAAINSVREFQIAKASAEGVETSAQSYVNSQISGVTVQARADDKALTVNVVIEKDVGLTIGKVIGSGNMHLRVSATAKINAKLPLCVLALDPSGPATLSLEESAQMTANGCMVYSDSSNSSGLQAKDNAILVSGLTCTAGGRAKTSGAKLTPDAVTDCPRMEDPLASRAPPSVGPCNYSDTVISGGTQMLQPGVYCRGLKITNGANVTLARGIYIVKDGPLVVDQNATMQGTDVGFFLKGQTANLTFATASTISLSAPKDGPMAGLLIYDDPTGASAPSVPYYPLPIPIVGGLLGSVLQILAPTREHKILSDNARLLLGTIYMPKGRLIIDATKPIADKSAYTVLVVQRIDLHDGPNLVLNSDYSATDVPVPHGVGPYGKVLLAN